MPLMKLNGVRLSYEDTGGEGRPTILFSHGLLWDTRMFEGQIAHLASRYRCIAYDHRGQGRSLQDNSAPMDMDTLYEDAVGLIDALGIGPCHWVGLSMGGFIGMRVAARHPEMIKSLTLLSTQSGPEDSAHIRTYKVLNTLARMGGLPLAMPRTMKAMFGDSFFKARKHRKLRKLYRDRLLKLPREIHYAVQGVLERSDITRELANITAPTMILHGTGDRAIDITHARHMAKHIPHATLIEIPDAGHMLNLEQPELVNQHLDDFLT